MLKTIEGVNKNLFESVFVLSTYLRLVLRERTNYFLVLEGEPPYSIAEGALSVDFYSKTVKKYFFFYWKISDFYLGIIRMIYM